ncbi:MAG TPA: adenylate/guanylate cyclase domain-containing protein, partial [Dehalococcoidia bacterium]
YATVGQGPIVVYVPGWPTHLELEWRSSRVRSFLEDLADGCTLVRYDMRGSGLSDADTDDFSLKALTRDLETVIDHLKLDEFCLMSMGMLAGPTAMTYAAAHPEKVRKLVLSTPYMRGNDIASPESEGVKTMISYVSQFGMPNNDFNDDPDLDYETRRELQRRQDEAARPRVQGALLNLMYDVDLSETADQLRLPTLVLHGRDDRIPFRLGRELAARLPDAKFVPFEGTSSAAQSRADKKLAPIREFLGLQPSERKSDRAGDVHTILFTDVEGSTALTNHLGDAKARDVLREHERITRSALAAHDGSEVKAMGDGFMASFGSATKALECAIALQREFSKHNESAAVQIHVRVGLNAGEPIAEDDPGGRSDLFGTAVNMAARIAAKADAGEILVADVVRQLVAGKKFLFNDRGDTVLRGFDEAVRLFEMRWHE